MLVLAAAVRGGGPIAIAVVARVADRTLGAVARIALFRELGRAYRVVGGVALFVALAAGAFLAAGRPWSALLVSSVAVAAALVFLAAVGIGQARRMTRLRERAASRPQGLCPRDAVRRGVRRATALRALIVSLSVTLVAMGMLLASCRRQRVMAPM